MHKLPFPKSQSSFSAIGECIVSDLVGPLQVESIGGAWYYVIFKDVFSKYKTAYFLKQKSETADCFLAYVKKVHTDTNQRVKMLRCDGGTEYNNRYLKTSLENFGIKLQTSAPYTPEQNGIAERDHRTTVESARSQIHARGIPLKLWAEAINYSVYVLNRTLSNTKSVTPFEHWYGVQPDISNLRVFGSVCYFLVADDLRQKLDPKATKGAYVGESEEQKASRVFVETTGWTHITRHVRVYENLPYWPLAIEPAPSVAEQPPSPLIDDITPEATIHPVTLDPTLGTKTKLLAVHLPVRKSEGALWKQAADNESPLTSRMRLGPLSHCLLAGNAFPAVGISR
jgi:hypothetical protein